MKNFLIDDLFNIYNYASRAQANLLTIKDCLSESKLFNRDKVEEKFEKLSTLVTELVLKTEESIMDEPPYNPCK